MGKRTMQVVKFVTKDFKSPGSYEQLDYSKFGVPIEVDADPKECGQVAKGIHVVPINEDVDLKRVAFTETMILLEIAEEDIVYCEQNGVMRVRKAIPVRQVVESDDEWKIIRTVVYKNPEYACLYAQYVDKKTTAETRTAACKSPKEAYNYAYWLDKKPTAETRTAACKDPYYAYLYAVAVDKVSTAETRTAACNSPYYAYLYALGVDKKPTDETRSGACNDPYYAYMYAIDVDRGKTAETRTAACKCYCHAYLYATDVDRKPTAETKTAASKHTYWRKQYEQWEKSKWK
jgi:hypothetical protein